MGIESNVANVIVREHAWRPITGDVLLLGRQTMFFTPERAIEILKAAGLPVPAIQFRPEAKTRQSETNYISDDDFFRLLGIDKIKALDVSDYEGADIVHDLTKPIPDHLEGIADFILDGSTLDNVFDPATVLRNTARMLKSGGRLVAVNVASNSYGPYIIPTAHLLLDYFAVNGFSDCKAYILVYGPSGINVFTPDTSLLRKGLQQPQNFTSPYTMALVVMAEKGQHSTWNESPVQHQYRDDWTLFAKNLATIEASKRPELAWSNVPCFIGNSQYFFIDHLGRKNPAVGMYATPIPASYKETSGNVLLRELGLRAARRLLTRR